MGNYISPDGTMKFRIIRPGWGSSGFYKPDVLERDGPKVFRKGVKMFADHATPTEEAERPEGSVKNLVAELTEDARWDAVGPLGPDGKPRGAGLYAKGKVFETWRPFVEELAPHIGLSIRAMGRAVRGEAEGRKGPIIEGIVAAKSVDLVTAAGAGGEIISMFESARARAQETITVGGDDSMSEQELQEAQAAREAAEKELAEAKEAQAAAEAENARLKETEILRESVAFVDLTLPKTVEGIAPAVWELTRARLAESLKAAVVVADGAIDTGAFKEAIDVAVAAEVAYLAQITESGKVRGMGPGGDASTKPDLKESFRALGLSEAEAETAARGR